MDTIGRTPDDRNTEVIVQYLKLAALIEYRLQEFNRPLKVTQASEYMHHGLIKIKSGENDPNSVAQEIQYECVRIAVLSDIEFLDEFSEGATPMDAIYIWAKFEAELHTREYEEEQQAWEEMYLLEQYHYKYGNYGSEYY